MRTGILTALAMAATPVTAHAEWSVNKHQSSVDDSTVVVASGYSEKPVRDRFGNPSQAAIVLRCKENKTDWYIMVADAFFADSGGFGEVTLRIDKDPAFNMAMTESTDHRALGLWDGEGVNLARSMVGGNRILAVVTPFNEAPMEIFFSLKGYDAAARAVGGACGW